MRDDRKLRYPLGTRFFIDGECAGIGRSDGNKQFCQGSVMNLAALRGLKLSTRAKRLLLRVCKKSQFTPVVPGLVKLKFSALRHRRAARRLAAAGLVELALLRPHNPYDADGGWMKASPRLHARPTDLGKLVARHFEFELWNGSELRWRRLIEDIALAQAGQP